MIGHNHLTYWCDHLRHENHLKNYCHIHLKVRRKIGLKALELGGNAVTGYRQCFDLEGETGIVVRGIGTAVIKKLA